jgi:hypothetical protein
MINYHIDLDCITCPPIASSPHIVSYVLPTLSKTNPTSYSIVPTSDQFGKEHRSPSSTQNSLWTQFDELFFTSIILEYCLHWGCLLPSVSAILYLRYGIIISLISSKKHCSILVILSHLRCLWWRFALKN